MTVGLPGTGVGGMFYMLSALVMPLVEALRRARDRRPGAWREVIEQVAITAGILGAMAATGWLVVKALANAARLVLPMMSGAARLPTASVIRTAMLVLTLGTLALVLTSVELLRLWVHRRKRNAAVAEDAPESATRAKRAAVGGRARVILLLAAASLCGVRAARAQTTRLATKDRARADSNDSRATYRLAELRRNHPLEALPLFQRYVTLEPSDPWGYIAVAGCLADATRYREALHWYALALRLAPGERDAVVGRAQVLVRAGQTDAAIAAYELWLTNHPQDAAAWRELAREKLRAGRAADAVRALEHVQALAPNAKSAAQLRLARAAAAPAITPAATGSRDSDGNTTLRLGGAADFAAGGATRLGLSASRARASDGVTTAAVDQLSLTLSARPQATLSLDGSAGATRLDLNGGAPGSTIPTGLVRVRWRAPGARTAIDVRAQRTVLDATPLLLANRVVRTEFNGVLQLPIAPSVTVRGLGRFATLNDSAETNQRMALGGVLAFAVKPSVEISGQVHEMGYAHGSLAGYFAPRRAQVVEAGSYFEIETPGAALIACDLGAGVQRVALQGAPFGPWRRALRLYSLVSVPLAPGRDLRFEFDSEDSAFGSEAAATTAQWRYATATLSLRWAVP